MADSTPPSRAPPSTAQLEHIRRTEEARLKSKAARAAHDASNTTLNPSTKRPAPYNQPTSVRNAPAMSTPAADAAAHRLTRRTAYTEYDLSTMRDTKGGFLSAQDDPLNRALHGAPEKDKNKGGIKPTGMTEAEWERLQLLTKLRKNRAGPFEPGLSVLTDKEERKKESCRECGSVEVDWNWVETFGVHVCNSCKEEMGDKYSLLTKTEAREDYLLTNPELQDADLLRHLKRPNPHHATWNDMQLYLRFQVEEYAFSAKKWGSPEALDAEFERRVEEKRARKEKKFRVKLDELKKKTRTDAYRRNRLMVEKGSKHVAGIGDGDGDDVQFGMRLNRGDRHVHEWGRPLVDEETGVEVKKCLECGVECEELEL
ncbi:DNA repair protein [Microthyrium microscopicum]|uniref:DNA repair protein RAD14 n=1 Tax=Microthyrium microscopicum TaxID=703497 RepID=A0A6A6U4S1_9PEZI|nr:DNA repair protein [Microthyrium microscopicum]